MSLLSDFLAKLGTSLILALMESIGKAIKEGTLTSNQNAFLNAMARKNTAQTNEDRDKAERDAARAHNS